MNALIYWILSFCKKPWWMKDLNSESSWQWPFLFCRILSNSKVSACWICTLPKYWLWMEPKCMLLIYKWVKLHRVFLLLTELYSASCYLTFSITSISTANFMSNFINSTVLNTIVGWPAKNQLPMRMFSCEFVMRWLWWNDQHIFSLWSLKRYKTDDH